MAAIYNDIQTVVPVTGDSIQIEDTDQDNVLIINPATDIAALTVLFPTAPHPGQRVTLLSTHKVTALTLSGGIFNFSPGTIAATGFAVFMYDPVNSAWMDGGHDVSAQIATVAALYRGKPFNVTTTGGTAVVYLTDNGLSTGNPLFSSIDYVHLDFVSNDPNFGKSWALTNSNKTLTITAVKQAFTGISLLSTNVLGSVAIGAAVNGTAISVLVVGKLN